MTETKPVLFRPHGEEGGVVAAGLAEPSMTLVEGGPAVGVLVAEACREGGHGGRFFLDRVTWVRGDESVRTIRDFPCVCLYRADGVWVAEETAGGKLFPRPSRMAYRTVFLPEADYRRLMDRRAAGDAMAILLDAQQRFGGLPGFRLEGERLRAPEAYAAAEAAPAGKGFITEGEAG